MATDHRRGITWRGTVVLGQAIKREPLIFTAAAIGAALFGVLTIADAWVLGWATDHVLTPALGDDHRSVGAGAVVGTAAFFVGVALVRAFGVVVRRICGGIMIYRLQAKTRRAVTRQYLRLPLQWHKGHSTGELLSNANSDVEATWGPLNGLPMAIGTFVMIVVAVVQMIFTDLPLACVGLLVFPLVVVVNLYYQRWTTPLMVRAQQLRAELSEVAHESFDGALVVKTLGREAEESARFDARARELRDANVRAGYLRAVFDPLLAALPNFGVLAVLVVGVLRVRSGAVDAGHVVTVAYLMTLVSFPIRSIGWVLGEFPRSVVGFERVSAVLAADAHTAHGRNRLAATGPGLRVDVEDLVFGFIGELPVLSGLDVHIPSGRSVALVGATASGKSTLTTLLARLIDPESGRILLDGADLRDFDEGEIANAVALVPQGAFIFDDTVLGNVTLGEDFSRDEVWAALRAARAEEFIGALPEGLDSMLDERGTSLSGGQRQRLALARALVRRPRLLILDDATSAVDPQTEATILAGLRSTLTGQASGTTLVVVAYRKSTISLADEVLFLVDGRIADRGTHAELSARNPGYAELVNAYEAVEEML